MPLQSEAQRKYLWANDPELARKFEAETPKGAKLPARKRKTEHVADETEVVELKDFSDKERAKLAKKHEAMPGGGFPIRNGADLRNAIQAVGRAKNPAAARAWIVKRAKELKLTDALPQGWELAARVEDLELAVLALGGGQEFVGDLPGHPFHGNQYSDVSGKEARQNAEADRKTADALGPRPAPKNGVPQMRYKPNADAQDRRDTYSAVMDSKGKLHATLDWAVAPGRGVEGGVNTDVAAVKKDVTDAVSSYKDVHVGMIEPNGPGGGWPSVVIHGDPKQVDRFLADYEDGNL